MDCYRNKTKKMSDGPTEAKVKLVEDEDIEDKVNEEQDSKTLMTNMMRPISYTGSRR